MTGSSMVGRRAFVAGSVGALVATAAAIGLAAPAGAATTATAWTLSTTWSIPRGARGRLSCRCAACRAHSENKIYATSAAATIGRAHRNCLCIPIQYPMAADAYAAIFATADQADRRDPAVQAVLATSASAPPATSTPTPPATSTSTSPSGPSDARSASGGRPHGDGVSAVLALAGLPVRPTSTQPAPTSTAVAPGSADRSATVAAPTTQPRPAAAAALRHDSTSPLVRAAELLPLPILAGAAVIAAAIRLRNRALTPPRHGG
jgi:hypothetical protein